MVKENERLLQNLKQMKVLVIDEVTHLTDQMLDTLDVVLRNAVDLPGKSTLPFGGRQLEVAGGPFQPEAIVERFPETKESLRSRDALVEIFREEYSRRRPGPVQNSLSWLLTFGGYGDGIVVLLHRNHRQEEHASFFNLLCRVRIGTCTSADIEQLNSTSAHSKAVPLSHTRLCLRKTDVQATNSRILKNIKGPLHRLHSIDSYTSGRNMALEKCLESAASGVIETKIRSEALLTFSTKTHQPGSRVAITDIVPSTATSKNAIEALTVYIHQNDTTLRLERTLFRILSH